jgi:hypothetical protein
MRYELTDPGLRRIFPAPDLAHALTKHHFTSGEWERGDARLLDGGANGGGNYSPLILEKTNPIGRRADDMQAAARRTEGR